MGKVTHEGSNFVRHCACEACGSSDANALYDDGHTHCHRCGERTRGDGSTPTTSRRPRLAGELIQGGEYRSLPSRKITEETCRKFGYICADSKGTPVQVAPYFNAAGEMVAQKTRTKDKQFSVRGDVKDALPFGANVWPKTGKRVTVTEGELDALSMSQVQGNTWPVVSLPNGAAHAKKHVAQQRDYYLGFDEVVLMFDSDEPGRKAAQEVAEVLGSRARIAELPLKDANEMLVAGRTKELIDAMWRAKPYRPEGIVDMATLKEQAKKPPESGIAFWSPRLTELTYGIRLGEIHCFGAGTGGGKTDFFTQQMEHMVTNLGLSVGVFSLEQQVTQTAVRIAGKRAKKPLHIPDGSWTEAEFDAAWDAVTKGPAKVWLYDSFGVNDWDAISAKIEFLVHSEGVRYFFIDHLTALATGRDEDERVVLEHIMSNMGGLVVRLGCTIFLVSHLNTPEGTPHEEGGRVTQRNFKGSSAIRQWAHFMYGLERNQQADTEEERCRTIVRVLKDRNTGRATGEVVHTSYDKATGLLYETSAPDAASKHGFKDETINSGGVPSDF